MFCTASASVLGLRATRSTTTHLTTAKMVSHELDSADYVPIYFECPHCESIAVFEASNHRIRVVRRLSVSECSSPGGYYTYEGTDVPDVSDGRPAENVFTGNKLPNTPTGIFLKQADSFEFIGTRLLFFHVLSVCRWFS